MFLLEVHLLELVAGVGRLASRATKHWREMAAVGLQATGTTAGLGFILNSRLRGGLVRGVNYHATPEVDRDNFRSHIRYYRRSFTVLGAAELTAFLEGALPLERPGLIVTFDDGFRTNYTVAADVLDEFGIKGFFFIPAHFIQCAGSLVASKEFVAQRLREPWRDEDFMPMTWNDLRDLVRRGHTVGCHTMTHHALGGHQEEQTLYREIVEAKFVIERSIGTTVQAFCWPFGSLSSYSKEAFDLVRRHYSYGFTTFGAPLLVGGSPYGIDRSPVQASMRLPRVRCAVQGVTELWLARRRRRFETLVEMPRSVTADM